MSVKKLLAVTLLLSLILGLAAGCGGNDSDTVSDNSTDFSAAETKSTEPNETDEAGDTGEVFPLAESVTLTMWAAVNPQLAQYVASMEDLVIYGELEKRTNVHIEFVDGSTGDMNDTMAAFSLMIASGTYPDIIPDTLKSTYGLDYGIENDIILDLKEYVEEYMPNYRALLESNEEYAKGVVTDSGYYAAIYGLISEGYPVPYGPVIRKDWLDDLSLNAPVTYADYHDVLTAFKIAYDASAPLFLSNAGVPNGDYLTAGYGVAGFNIGNQAPYYQVDGVVKYGPIEDGFLEYLQMMKQWYDEGLIDPDFMNSGEYMFPPNDLVANNDTGIWYTLRARFDSFALLNDDPDFAIMAITDAVQQEGDVNKIRFNNSLVSSGTCLSYTCSDPVLAAQWLDYWYSDEGWLLTNYGIENEAHTIDSNGKPVLTEFITNNPNGLNLTVALGIYAVMDGGGAFLQDWTRTLSSFSDAAAEAGSIWAASTYDYGMPITMTMTQDEGSDHAQYYSDISTYVNESILKFITGVYDFDYWDTYVTTIEQMSIEKCISIKQDALTRYLNR